MFDLLNIPLYHGWVVDPQTYETVEAIGNMGYNELVESIIQGKMSEDCSVVTKGKQSFPSGCTSFNTCLMIFS